jgi:hypothetical protein
MQTFVFGPHSWVNIQAIVILFLAMTKPDLKGLFQGLEQGHFDDILETSGYSSFEIPDFAIFKEQKVKQRRYRPERAKRKPRLPRKRKARQWDSDESENENAKRITAHHHALNRRRKKYPVKFEKTIGSVVGLRHPTSERQRITSAKSASIPTLEDLEADNTTFNWIEDPLKRRNMIINFRQNQRASTPDYVEVTDDLESRKFP